MSVQIAVLASGSQGNATLVQTGGSGFLLDLGLGPRALTRRLESVGSSWEQIASAVLTHTHGDHVNNATLIQMTRLRITLYCHEGHRRQLGRSPGFHQLDRAGLVRHYDERPFLTSTGLRIEPLELRHDGGPTFGFRVEAKPARGARAIAMGYMADTGSWTEAMADALAQVDLLGVEFNHDVEMQRRAPRSYALIARNLGDWGHLSNHQGAEFVTAVLDRSAPGSVRHVVLLHLSQQCNDPTLAVSTARAAIRASGRRVAVHAATQAAAFPNVVVTPTRRRAAKAAAQGPLLPF
ncbi:MBL fold metallo-hydrolase [Singulisphaera sp. GP187]|uniref:MBL fold metallo-hydrolase n=1 Tax=Singulisphaera sp. GP187 TaxID=1882752 RepID=UPI00094174E8|nr:MBL fold metallo-hydrolase [Singulisphaera sp. GP187]